MKIRLLLLILMAGLPLIIVFEMPWQVSRAQEAPDGNDGRTKDGIKIIEEKGPKGHRTIGIMENSVASDSKKELSLTFRSLMTWKYEKEQNTRPPEGIEKLKDRKVRLTGFMYPLQEGTPISYFCLLRTTQTCCYGPRPQYNQYVFVEMKKPTRFHRLSPVSCVGLFKVEPTPEEGFIYRMEGDSCEVLKR